MVVPLNCSMFSIFAYLWQSLFNTLLKSGQVPGVTDLGLAPRGMRKVAILGGGLMGSGIATALILGNYPVILKEVNDNLLQVGIVE